jgi:hypothetical protein
MAAGAAAGTGPIVRGTDLSGLPQAGDVTKIAELYEPDPERADAFRLRPGVFFMRLGVVNVGPWLYVPANSGSYFLALRPDPTVVEDIIYGPLVGDAAEDMGLLGWLREQASGPDPGYGLRVVRDMVASGDASLAGTAYAFARGLGEPESRDGYDPFIEAIRVSLEVRRASPLADDATAALAHLSALAQDAREAWEQSRPVLRDERYAPGTPLAEAGLEILWSPPNEVGLRLGLAGVGPGAQWRIGETVEFEVYVRNDGPAPVKFSWTPRADEGLTATLRGIDAAESRAEITSFSAYLIPLRARLEPGQMLRVKQVALDLGSPEAAHSPEAPQRARNRFVVEPGAYRLEATVALSQIETAPPAGEWVGVLTSRAVEVSVAQGRPVGSTGAEPRHGWTAEVLGQWRVEFGEQSAVPVEALGRLAALIREYSVMIEESAGALSHPLAELEAARPLRWEEAQRILDAVCDVSAEPVTQLALNQRIWPGRDWTDDQVAALAFGSPAANGLRAAVLFEPAGGVYRIGDEVRGRILFHNSGDTAVEFGTYERHWGTRWHCRDATGDEVDVISGSESALMPNRRFRLEPGQVCEVPAGRASIVLDLDAELGFVVDGLEQMAVDDIRLIPVRPGDRITSWWDVELVWGRGTPDALGVPATLPTGEVTFAVVAPAAAVPPQPGAARSAGIDGDSAGVELRLAQADSGGTGQPAGRGNSVVPGRNASDGGQKEPIAAQVPTFAGRTVAEWDELLGDASIPRSGREEARALGYGIDAELPADAVPVVLELLGSGAPVTKCRCIGLLRKLDDPSDAVLDAVLRSLNEPSPGVRTRAAYYLASYPGRSGYTVPRLAALLGSGDPGVQESAAFALGRLGPAARPALPALERLRPAASGPVREAIDRAIGAVGDGD